MYHFLSHPLAKASHVARLNTNGVRKGTPPTGRNSSSCDNKQRYMILLQGGEQTIGNNSKITIISDGICTTKEKYTVICKSHQVKLCSSVHKVPKIKLCGQVRHHH